MNDIITLLKNNTSIAALVGSHIYANYTEYLGDCLVYTFNTTYNDRCVKKQRLKITIIAEQLTTVEALEEAIKDTIVSRGDDTINGYTNIVINGGGDLYDASRNKNHRILYFDTIKRGD